MHSGARQGALGWRREGPGQGPAASTQVLVAWDLRQASFLIEDFLGTGAADHPGSAPLSLPASGTSLSLSRWFSVLGQEPEEHLRAVLLCTEGRAAPHSSAL